MEKYLPLYYEWMEKGEMPEAGLCNCFGCFEYGNWKADAGFHDLELLFPFPGHGVAFWAADDSNVNTYYGFGKLRQNIVLLMAAMNNEL